MTSEFLRNLPTPEHCLIVLAHPDDAEFFAGGTLAKWAEEGCRLTLFLMTSGDKGSGDLTTLDGMQVAALRENEARCAAEKLGIGQVIFQRMKDGELSNSLELRRAIVRMIRLKRPDAVMSSDPLLRTRGHNRVNHPDHWSVAEAVLSAVYPAARDHLNFVELFRDENLAPHIVKWLYMALSPMPNYRVETTPYRRIQIDALKEHKSQVGDPVQFEKRMHERYDPDLTIDETSPRYAEYFRVIQLN
ncbi:MAG: PIG-L family deacetylase [Anaerolineae bacterium]|nr:MAG: PIG-L family deacetylase [Anaerolineae bacterium]MCL4877438.1 PIG-L family deacetylase [Anaerolineae bacterium]